MSFGFSVGDVLAVVALANKIRKDFSGAPEQFKHIAQDVRSLAIVIQDANVNVDQMSEDQVANFQEILSSCQALLQKLEKTVDKWTVLDEPKKGKIARRLRKRLKWDPAEIADLRSQLIAKTTLLSAYNEQATSQNVVRLIHRSDDKERQKCWSGLVLSTTPPSRIIFLADSKPDRESGCDPGTGKTFTTAMVITTLQDQAQDSPKILNTYVYCTYQTPDQDVQGLLSSLLRNSIQQIASIPDPIVAQYQKKRKANHLFLRDEIIRLLELLYGSFERVNLLVDALDELPSQVGRPFISELLRLQGKCKFNVFVTSRPIPELQPPFVAQGAVCVEIRASDEDVHQFLKDAMFQLPSFVNRSPVLQAEIITAITEASSGMFLLAELHLRSLSSVKSPKALRFSLSKLSIGSNAYDQVYEDIMARISALGPESEALAKQALLILCCARQPLLTEDLVYALSIEPDSTTIEDDNVPDVEDIVATCAGLVIIDKESNVVRLGHKSAQEYFERNQEQWFPAAHDKMARLCMHYKDMSITRAAEDAATDIERLPFWRYAHANYAHHLVLASHEGGVVKEQSENSLKGTKGSSLFSVANLAASLIAKDMAGSLHSALVTACREGRHALTELLLSVNDYNLNQPARYSNERLRSEILNTQQDANSLPIPDGKGWWVEQQGKIQVKVIDESGSEESSAAADEHLLTIAAQRNDLAMIELLFKNGANPNIANRLGQTAIYIAAKEGYDVFNRYTWSILWTPLLAATHGGHVGCVELLLERANRQYRDQRGRNAASIAAAEGHAEVLKELLKWSDVELCTIATKCPSALEFAMMRKQRETSLLLIPLLDINCTFTNGERPLHCAARTNQPDVLHFALCRRGVIVNAKDGQGCTFLHKLATCQFVDRPDFLKGVLGHPAVDLNALNRDGNTPLLVAARANNVTMVTYLLERQDVDVNARDHYGDTTLLIATWRGNNAMVTGLLARQDVDINAANADGDTALIIAASLRSEPVFEEIFRHPGIDRNRRNKAGHTILSGALKIGDQKRAELILRETDLAIQFQEVFSDGGTLLSYACKEGCNHRSKKYIAMAEEFIAPLSPPNFMHLANDKGVTPEEYIREYRRHKDLMEYRRHKD
ncbi:Ankyrin-1 [Paramyrothecium foliicola]|nr:Ankyrin-1 [Paramyrothecium foliicola]